MMDKPCRDGEYRAYGACVRHKSSADALVREYRSFWANAEASNYDCNKAKAGMFLKAAYLFGDHEVRAVVDGIRREDYYSDDLGLPMPATDLGGIDYAPGPSRWPNTWRGDR